MGKLTQGEVKKGMSSVREWSRKGSVISRTFKLKDFPAALKFVNTIGRIAEKAQHHPDIDIRWNKVTMALTTHDSGGLTDKDFAMAAKIDAAFKK